MLNKKTSPYSMFSSRKIVKAENIYRPDGETLWSEIQKKQEIINNTQNDNQLLKVRINQLEKQVKAYEATILENDRWKKFQRFIQDGEYKTGQETLVINLRRDLHEKDKLIQKLTEDLNLIKKQTKVTKIQELELQQQYYLNHVADLNILLNTADDNARKKTMRKQTWQKEQQKQTIGNTEQHTPKKKSEMEGIIKRKRHNTQTNFKSSTEEIKIIRKTTFTDDNRQAKTEQNDYASFQKELILCVQKSKENLLLIEKQDEIQKLQKQILSQEEQFNKFTRLIEKGTQEKMSFEQTLTKQQQTIQMEKNLVNKLSQEIITLKQIKEQANLEVQNLMNENRLLQQKIEQATQIKQDDKNIESQNYKHQFDLLQQKIKRLDEEVNQEKNQNLGLGKENEELTKKNQTLSETVSQLQNNCQELIQSIKEKDELIKLQLQKEGEKNHSSEQQIIQKNNDIENDNFKIKEDNKRLTEDCQQIKIQLKLLEEKNQQLYVQLEDEKKLQKTNYEKEYNQNIEFFLQQAQQQSAEIDNFELLLLQQKKDYGKLLNDYQQLQQQNEEQKKQIVELQDQLDAQFMKNQYFENQEKEITLFVLGQENQPKKQINVKLRYTINDLFQHLKFIGFHQLSQQNIVCHIPIFRIRYGVTEWNKKIIDLVTEREINQGMEIEFEKI